MHQATTSTSFPLKWEWILVKLMESIYRNSLTPSPLLKNYVSCSCDQSHLTWVKSCVLLWGISPVSTDCGPNTLCTYQTAINFFLTERKDQAILLPTIWSLLTRIRWKRIPRVILVNYDLTSSAQSSICMITETNQVKPRTIRTFAQNMESLSMRQTCLGQRVQDVWRFFCQWSAKMECNIRSRA